MQNRTDWNEWIDRCAPRALRVAMGVLHNEEDARDACQDVFVSLLGASEPRNPDAWIYRAVLNRAINLRKLNESRKKREKLAAARETSAGEHEAAPDKAEQLEKLHGEIAALPEKRRMVFLLRHQAGMRIQEIALTLRLSEGTVKKQLSRALETLRRRLAIEGENG